MLSLSYQHASQFVRDRKSVLVRIIFFESLSLTDTTLSIVSCLLAHRGRNRRFLRLASTLSPGNRDSGNRVPRTIYRVHGFGADCLCQSPVCVKVHSRSHMDLGPSCGAEDRIGERAGPKGHLQCARPIQGLLLGENWATQCGSKNLRPQGLGMKRSGARRGDFLEKISIKPVARVDCDGCAQRDTVPHHHVK